MYLKYIGNYIVRRWLSIAIQCFLTFLTYILLRYKYRQTSSELFLNKKTAKHLLEIFNSNPLIDNKVEPYKFKNVKANFSNFDVFNLGGRYKDVIKQTILEYGVGSCGPRGFYGTIDAHLELEEKLASIFGKESAILYSNYFNCVQSVISSFCKSRNNIFIDKNASEAIKRGLELSRSKAYYFESLEDLEMQLAEPITDKYVVCERMGTNTGKLLNLEKLLELKERYRFRIILDESYTIPFLYQEPEDKELYNSVELIIGSLSHGYPTNGGFCIGCKEAIDYQRLAGASYVFSASLPAFMSKAVMCMLDEIIDYSKIKEKINLAFKYVPGIVTDPNSPIVLIETQDPSKSLEQLREEGYVVGRNGNLIRLCINEKTEENDLKMIGEIIKSIC